MHNDDFEIEKLKLTEVIYIFGDSKEKFWITDWRGEENKREIEQYIANKLKINPDWTNVNELRNGADEEKQEMENL